MNTTLTPTQRDDVRRARALLAASGPGELAALVETRTSRPVHDAGDPYPEAFGLAHVYLTNLLAIIDDLTSGGAS